MRELLQDAHRFNKGHGRVRRLFQSYIFPSGSGHCNYSNMSSDTDFLRVTLAPVDSGRAEMVRVLVLRFTMKVRRVFFFFFSLLFPYRFFYSFFFLISQRQTKKSVAQPCCKWCRVVGTCSVAMVLVPATIVAVLFSTFTSTENYEYLFFIH